MLLDVPLVEATLDLVRDPALLPAIGACALAVLMLPWWTVPLCAAAISIAGEIIELHERAVYGFQFGDELLLRAGTCLVVFGLMHFSATGFRNATERRARTVNPLKSDDA